MKITSIIITVLTAFCMVPHVNGPETKADRRAAESEQRRLDREAARVNDRYQAFMAEIVNRQAEGVEISDSEKAKLYALRAEASLREETAFGHSTHNMIDRDKVVSGSRSSALEKMDPRVLGQQGLNGFWARAAQSMASSLTLPVRGE